MRLRTASIIGVARRIDWPIALSYTRPSRRRIVGRCQFMFVDCQLLHGKRGLADSAGKAGRRPTQATPAAGSGCPHDVCQGIVRRQTGGTAGLGSSQAVGVGLATAGSIGRLFSRVRTAPGFCDIAISALVERMSMARHLCYRQRRGPHSAGNTVTFLQKSNKKEVLCFLS